MNKRLYFFDGYIKLEDIYKGLYDIGIKRDAMSDQEFYDSFIVISNIYGYRNSIEKLNKCKQDLVFTNCVHLLSQDCFFNKDTNKWEIFVWKGKKHFVNIQDLTDKELRQAHNIERVYRNGGLDY